jgi:hypothetical protein
LYDGPDFESALAPFALLATAMVLTRELWYAREAGWRSTAG